MESTPHRLSGPQHQQQGQEQRRGVIQRHRRRQRDHGNGVEIHHQRNKAGEAAHDMGARMGSGQRQATNQYIAADQQGGDEAAPEHQFGGRELGRAELDADAHAGEKQARRNHPEGLHGFDRIKKAPAAGPAQVLALQVRDSRPSRADRTRGSAACRLPSATGRGRLRCAPVSSARGGRGPCARRCRRPRSRSPCRPPVRP
jgi:hypothetical protein